MVVFWGDRFMLLVRVFLSRLGDVRGGVKFGV